MYKTTSGINWNNFNGKMDSSNMKDWPFWSCTRFAVPNWNHTGIPQLYWLSMWSSSIESETMKIRVDYPVRVKSLRSLPEMVNVDTCGVSDATQTARLRALCDDGPKCHSIFGSATPAVAVLAVSAVIIGRKFGWIRSRDCRRLSGAEPLDGNRLEFTGCSWSARLTG